MKVKKTGSRHPLLLYTRVMDRLWRYTLALGMLLLAVWGYSWWTGEALLHAQYYRPVVLPGEVDLLLLAGAVMALGFSLFAFFARRMAYVQPRRDHIRLVTPFLRTNISYRRILSTHPSEFAQIFPPKDASWAQRRLLEPFYGKTAVVLELSGFPMPPAALRLFLAPQMFYRRSKGLVLLVPDWMAFSTEIDSLMGAWQQLEKQKHRPLPGALR
jgi:hypothetical protein